MRLRARTTTYGRCGRAVVVRVMVARVVSEALQWEMEVPHYYI